MTLSSALFDPLVDSGLSTFSKGLEKEFSSFTASKDGFLRRLAEYVLINSGKRLRPALNFTASRFGEADDREVLETSMAVEMIHIATLVHDDLVDEAVMRRRKPTVGVQFGDGAGVLLGD